MRSRRDPAPAEHAEARYQDGQLTEAALRARLQSRTKDQLIALVERVACDSPELASRIDYLTDQATAA